jgi:hypothetical protein
MRPSRPARAYSPANKRRKHSKVRTDLHLQHLSSGGGCRRRGEFGMGKSQKLVGARGFGQAVGMGQKKKWSGRGDRDR